jgi:shikimate kinase
MADMTRLTIIGYRGCGKSTVAELLSGSLGLPWHDADVVLEGRAGCSIATLVHDQGEDAFRDLEQVVLADLLAGPPAIIATGGGVVLRPANRRLLRAHGRPVVWLSAAADIVRRRLAADPMTVSRRPALSGSDPLEEVAATLIAREPLYREAADVTFDTGRDSPSEITAGIVAWLVTRGSSMPGGSSERTV